MDALTVSTAQPRHDISDPRSAGTSSSGQPFFGEDGLTFGDVLDVINPLQHIPILNGIYRRLTGDEISTGSRLAGGALFGGAIGFASAMVNSLVDDTTGRDVGEHVMAMFWPEPGKEQGQDLVPQSDPSRNMAASQQDAPQIAELQEQEQRHDRLQIQPQDQSQDLVSALMLMAGQPNNVSAVTAPVAPPVAEPAYLAAMPSRAAATTISQKQPVPSPSGNAPSLSPAAMNALIASLTGGESSTAQDEEGAATIATDIAQDPASYAVWQAAMEQRLATAH